MEVIEYKLEDTDTDTDTDTDLDLDCGVCGDKLHVRSKEVRKELVVIPARVLVKEHVSYIYSCRNCENTGEQGNVVKAVTPKALIPKSPVSPSVLAYTMNQKYVMAALLYRQEQEWKRQ